MAEELNVGRLVAEIALEAETEKAKQDTKNAVDWIDNYSRTKQEPEYLPVRLPVLLINGSFGIGVGINSNIPTHNLIEVCEATRALIKNQNVN